MHRATHAARTAGVLAQHLRQQAVEIAPQRQEVRMGPVRAEDAVPLPDVIGHPDGRGLLADDQVAGAFDDGLAELVADLLLGTADLDQFAQPPLQALNRHAAHIQRTVTVVRVS
jgi:hypothetical protein